MQKSLFAHIFSNDVCSPSMNSPGMRKLASLFGKCPLWKTPSEKEEESSWSQPFVMSQRVHISLPCYQILLLLLPSSHPVCLSSPACRRCNTARFQQETRAVFFLNLTNETRWSGRLSKPGASASQALTYGEREARRHCSQRRFFCLKIGDKYDKKDRPFVIKWKQP